MTKRNHALENKHPGQILKEYYLDEMGISAYRLAKAIGVQQTRISQIIHGKRSITVDTALKLSKFFSLSDRFWINLQADYDVRKYREDHRQELDAVESYSINA